DKTVEGLAALTGDQRFAFDSYRRFIQMYGDVVLGVDHGAFEDILENFKNLNGFAADTDLDAEAWREIIADYKAAIEREYGAPFPQDTNEQLWGAIAAVFDSWHNPRAETYRRLHDIPDDWGTAVTVQAMVFGNLGDNSATGVAFTRNPSTGEKEIFGEYLPNAQGEDVVAGIRTPHALTKKSAGGSKETSLEVAMPDVFAELKKIFDRLESHYRDMQDVEFTVQIGKLWVLQTRSGKRTTEAALRVAVDLAAEGLITQDEAILRVEPAQLDQLLHPAIDPSAEHDLIAKGLPASPGAASGEIVFHSEMAEALKAKGRDVILVRSETSPEDVHGMHAAVGILTARGGMTSHAAVVARGMGRPCVSGAGTLRIDANAGTMRAGTRTFKSGDIISIDGSSGRVYAGKAKMLPPQLSGTFATVMEWADKTRRMKVRTNADTPRDARQARSFGA
ncbi:MAG TPA: PEP/pyruvate-binding domain-containing protein, partial [Hyphomicrobium sp.]|nr:PEP/pyruvate-binding domain-containing protein [Hyphomicrobium sp.]